jgi:hypothetical protein
MIVASGTSFFTKGVWMVEEDAIKHLGITAAEMAVYKNLSCPSNIHLEHGGKVAAPMPYSQFQFVYISPDGTNAGLFDITLRQWSMMCDYFSHNNATQSNDDDNMLFNGLFEKYTGLEATPTKITAAFESGLMKSSAKLPKAAPKRRGRRPKNNNNNAIDEVYTIILQKMIHSRFAVVFRRWKEEHCQKHDVSLRSKLKASVDNNKGKQQPKRPATEQPDDDESAIDVKKAKTS